MFTLVNLVVNSLLFSFLQYKPSFRVGIFVNTYGKMKLDELLYE